MAISSISRVYACDKKLANEEESDQALLAIHKNDTTVDAKN